MSAAASVVEPVTMYLDHFGLNAFPFNLKPDARFLYPSKAHSRARAYMDYALWSRDGFAVITGRIGTGKTTLVQHLLSRVDDEKVFVVKLHQTQLDEIQFLQALLVKFGVEAFSANKVELLTLINKHLAERHAKGQQVVLIIDEAHHLSARVLEEIRFLSGVEVDNQEVLNVILVGHPELNKTLDSPEMEQLAQRVRLRMHIDGLPENEVKSYIAHRLVVAGGSPAVFELSTARLICHYTDGIPRLINSLCDTAMIAAYGRDAKAVTPELVMIAVKELGWELRGKSAAGKVAQKVHVRSPAKNPAAISAQQPLKNVARAAGPQAKPVLPGNSARDVNTANDDRSKISDLPAARLVLHCDGKNLGEFPVDKERISIGRNQRNDIVIRDIWVSKDHAEIVTTDKVSTIEDLSSSNGTWVNEKKIQVYSLREGDVLKLGKYRLVYTQELDSSLDTSMKVVRMPRR